MRKGSTIVAAFCLVSVLVADPLVAIRFTQLPAVPIVLQRYGFFYLRKGQPRAALCCFKRAILLGAESALLLYGKGRALAKLGRLWLAVASYTKALQGNPFFVRAVVSRAMLYIRLKRYSLARDDFYYALNIDSDNRFVFLQLGYLFLRVRCWHKALRWAKKAITKGGAGWYTAGKACYRLGRLRQACWYLYRALAVSKEKRSAFYAGRLLQLVLLKYGTLLKRDGAFRKAQNIFKRALRLNYRASVHKKVLLQLQAVARLLKLK